MPSCICFLSLEPSERHRLTFPVGWDLSSLEGSPPRPRWQRGVRGFVVARQPGGSPACDSATWTAWGTHVAEIRYGHNKDNRDRALEVVVSHTLQPQTMEYRWRPASIR